MTIAHQIDAVQFIDNDLLLKIDGKAYRFALKNISAKLLAANEWQRNLYTISPSGYGIHWSLIDEDLSIDGLLKQAGE
jgi:hypothetical protein